jgi:hypothetical protein
MATCPHCRRHFRTLEDEADIHDCPFCGYPPHGNESDLDDFEDDDFDEEDIDLDAEEDHIRDRDAYRGADDED